MAASVLLVSQALHLLFQLKTVLYHVLAIPLRCVEVKAVATAW
jgi:hypothetical protein